MQLKVYSATSQEISQINFNLSKVQLKVSLRVLAHNRYFYFNLSKVQLKAAWSYSQGLMIPYFNLSKVQLKVNDSSVNTIIQGFQSLQGAIKSEQCKIIPHIYNHISISPRCN